MLYNNVWRVCCFSYFGFSHWQVYRTSALCDSEPDGTRIYSNGVFDTEEEAKKYADMLNEQEDQKTIESLNWYSDLCRKE